MAEVGNDYRAREDMLQETIRELESAREQLMADGDAQSRGLAQLQERETQLNVTVRDLKTANITLTNRLKVSLIQIA